jgi:hypothetical protein
MFESRKTTQSGQIEIIWNKRTVFLLSLVAKEKAENWDVTVNQDTMRIQFNSEIKKSEPLFGPQQYFDAQKGTHYLLRPCQEDSALAIYQHKDWWVRPAFVSQVKDLPKRCQLILTQNGEDYLIILAVCGAIFRSDMHGTEAGICVTMASNDSGRQKIEDLSLVLAAGKNPYQCCKNAVAEALSYLGKQEMLREARQFPKLFEKLGWCTWDAFYQEVSQQGICQKLDEFSAKQLPVGWVLIDDGWLDVDMPHQELKGFDAVKERFPLGLSACVKVIKEKYQIESVGVWHAVMGYWNGLEKDSAAAAAYSDEIKQLSDGRLIPQVDAGKAFCFFDKWHAYLRNQCGIDFVKVDGQSAISLANTGRSSYGAASLGVQKGLNASAALHFQNHIINCMGMASEDMWNRPSSAIARSSDDFVPDVLHGFKEHALQNGYNNLLQGQFFFGDFDMFYSEHVENWQNSMLRAVSGGPIYISDKVGQTNTEVIWPLIRKDGTILRCEDVGQPTLDCLLADPRLSKKPFKLFNRYRDCYLMVAFHLGQAESCTGTIQISDFMERDKTYLVYAWKQKEVFLCDQESCLPFNLAENESELFLFIPRMEEITFIGILEKYLSCACIENVWQTKNKAMTWLRVTESGTFGFCYENKPRQIKVNGELCEIKERKENFYQISLIGSEEYWIEISSV